MTFTCHRDKYLELLSKYQSQSIETEAENEEALHIVEKLIHKNVRSREENKLYELLIVLIEKFEREYYSLEKASTPHSMLLFLMEEKEVKFKDLVQIIGSCCTLSEILKGKLNITYAQANLLGNFFQVHPNLFLKE